jgi:phage RecT family recombinase
MKLFIENQEMEIVDPIDECLQASVWDRLVRVQDYLPVGVDKRSWVAGIGSEINAYYVAARKQATSKQCKIDVGSIAKTVFNAAAVGLQVGDALELAYFVPMHDRPTNSIKCEYWPGYKGYIALGRETGAITTVSTEIVWRDEDFARWNDEDGVHFRHSPSLDRPDVIDVNDIKVAYAITRNKLNQSDVEFVAGATIRHLAKRGNVWKTHPVPMAKKTPIRRMSSRWPQSSQLAALAKLDAQAEDGVTQISLVKTRDPSADIAAATQSIPEWMPDLVANLAGCRSESDVRDVERAAKQVIPERDHDALVKACNSYLALIPSGE